MRLKISCLNNDYVLIIISVLLLMGLPISKMADLKWPGLHYDSVLYSTIPINLANGNGLTFDVYSELLKKQPSKEFSNHGPVMLIVFGDLFKTKNYEALFIAIQLINFFSVLGFSILLLRTVLIFSWLKKWQRVLIAALGSFVLLAVLLKIQGRPEHFVPIIIVYTELIVSFIRNGYWRILIRSVALGVIAATSPAVSVLLLSVLILYYYSMVGLQRFCVYLILIMLASFSSWCLIVAASYEKNIFDLILEISGGDIDRRALSEIPRVWIFDSRLPAVGILYLVFFYFYSWIILNKLNKSSTLKKIIASCFFINIVYWSYACGIKNPPVNYRAISLLPLAILFIFMKLNQVNIGYKKSFIINDKKKLMTIVIIFGIVSTGVIDLVLKFQDYKEYGVAYDDAKNVYQSLKRSLQPNEKIGIQPWTSDTTLVVLDSPPWGMLTCFYPTDIEKLVSEEKQLGIKFKYYLYKDEWWGERKQIGPFLLSKENPFLNKKSAPGYRFLIYERPD